MERVSLPADDLRAVEKCEIVVVGSGYGGAIAAARLAVAGHDVVLLERGRELLPGDYPADLRHVADEFQIDSPLGRIGHQTGLFDLRVNDDISVLVGCGLGGTSLINANVALEPDPRVMQDRRWPAALRRKGALTAEMAGALAALAARPYPHDWPHLRKLKLLEQAAGALGAQAHRPHLYVTFEDGPNQFGVQQKACILCGDCNAGCNHLAKNTLLMNYLPLAHQHRARIFCEVQVLWLEPARNASGWEVRYRSLDPDAPPDPHGVISAKEVILAAGALGSTEILLRSRDKGLALSQRLGHGFTGNGDTLGFAFDGAAECNSVGFGRDVHPLRTGRRWPRRPVGPAIAGVIRPHNGTLEDQYIIEENSWPGPIAGSLPWFLEAAALVGARGNRPALSERIVRALQELESMLFGPRHGAVARSLALLGMSFDDGKGVMTLDRQGRLGIDWPGVGQQPNAAIVNAGMSTAARALRADFVPDPMWTDWLKKRLITVHPLGGCCMGETIVGGVVDDRGRVFNAGPSGGVHEGLYVMDGAVVPMPLGANPSLTIAALAERNAALLVESLPNVPHTPPPGDAPRPLRVSCAAVGLEFAEALSGYISLTGPRGSEARSVADYEAAASDGRQDGSPIRYELTVRARDCRHLVKSPLHRARVDGFVEAPVVAAGRLRVTHGSLECLVLDARHTGTRNLIYRMTLRSSTGAGYFLEGFKIVHDGSPLRLWHETNTLYVTLREGPNARGRILAQGVMRRGVADFVKGLVTMRALHASSRLEGIDALWRFESFFAETLFMTYGGVLAPTTAFAPTVPPGDPIRPQPQSVHAFSAKDGVELRLTRVEAGSKGPPKGPVMLVHGLGASSRTFHTDTIEKNLAEYLSERGYDVWLLDYRASVLLTAARHRFTADDVALNDWPAAVEEVRRLTKADRIKVVAHCFGATTFFMARLAGVIPAVESAVCSQNGCHVVSPTLTWIKAKLHLERLVEGYFPTTLATKTEGLKLRLLDDALRLVPVPPDEVCHSEVCHRATALFGLLYDHANLTAATHDRLGDLFGEANSAALAHLAMMVRAGQLVNAKGENAYMPGVKEHLAIPISLIHGANNRCYLPKSTELTLEWMVQNNGPKLYDRRLFPGYGHIDSIFGRDAATDVYPYILERLEVGP